VAAHLPPPEDARRTFHLRPDGRFDPEDARAAAGLLDHHRRRRILTVTRVGATGADELNRAIRRQSATDAAGAEGPDGLGPGTPVMVTKNDPDRGLYNGDAGVVLRVAPSALVAVFARGDELLPFPLASLRGLLELAYASTVHKAQGSELDYAALVLPEVDLPLCTRELVYTAVTRVRRSIVVVGRRAVLDRAIARPLERSSGLARRLAI
jgi:exodeoxyribonuclease V alpha subunit